MNEARRYGRKIDFKIADKEGKTTLILAAKLRHQSMAIDIVKMAGNEIHLNQKDNDGMTALHYACALGLVNLADFLIKNGALVTVAIRNNDGQVFVKKFCPVSEANKIQEFITDPQLDLIDESRRSHIHITQR